MFLDDIVTTWRPEESIPQSSRYDNTASIPPRSLFHGITSRIQAPTTSFLLSMTIYTTLKQTTSSPTTTKKPCMASRIMPGDYKWSRPTAHCTLLVTPITPQEFQCETDSFLPCLLGPTEAFIRYRNGSRGSRGLTSLIKSHRLLEPASGPTCSGTQGLPGKDKT